MAQVVVCGERFGKLLGSCEQDDLGLRFVLLIFQRLPCLLRNIADAIASRRSYAEKTQVGCTVLRGRDGYCRVRV